MKTTSIIIVLCAFLSSCSELEKSVFFEDCSCNKIDFADGIKITDSLNHFSVKYPSLDWQPVKNLNEFHNGITGVTSVTKTLEALAITETIKGDSYISAEEEMTEEPFMQLVESGKIHYHGKERDWRIIKHDDEPSPYYSLYLTLDGDNVVHTINFTIKQEKNYKNKLCRLEKYLDHIEIF